MEENKTNVCFKKAYLLFLIFFLSFSWFFMFTYNFPFIWEDTWLFSAAGYPVTGEIKHNFTLFKNQAINFFKAITDTVNFYHVDYYRKTLNEFYVSFFGGVFGLNILHQRLAKTAMAGIFFVFIFLFINKIVVEEKLIRIYQEFYVSSYHIFIFLTIAYFLMLPEFWILTLNLVDSLLFTLIFEIAALYLFLFYYTDESLTNKYTLCILFFCIVFFSYITILTRHIGRVNFLLFVVFLLFTNKRKLLHWRYASLIFVLFFLSVPVLGIIQASLTGSSIMSDVLGISSQAGSSSKGGVLSMGLSFLQTIHYTFLPHSLFLLILFFLFLLLHLYGYLRINAPKNSEEQEQLIFLKRLAIFSCLWFFLTVFVFNFARGLVFDRTSFLRFQYSLFVVPQAIMLLCYAQWVYKKYFATKKILQYVIFLFILLAIVHNLTRLNEFRGGWGAYFLGYDTVRQYVDENAQNALLVVPFDHATPVYFFSSNKITMLSDLTNVTELKAYKQNYTRVFVTRPYELPFDDNSVVNITNLTIRDNSPYGWLKKAMDKYYAQPMYVYEVKDEGKI